MSFVINFPDHSQDRSRHQIKGFDMNSIGNRFFIQNNRSWYKVPMNFPVSDKENINLSQMLLDLVLRKSVANIDDMPVERRDMLGQRIMLVVLAKVSDQNFALIVGPSWKVLDLNHIRTERKQVVNWMQTRCEKVTVLLCLRWSVQSTVVKVWIRERWVKLEWLVQPSFRNSEKERILRILLRGTKPVQGFWIVGKRFKTLRINYLQADFALV